MSLSTSWPVLANEVYKDVCRVGGMGSSQGLTGFPFTLDFLDDSGGSRLPCLEEGEKARSANSWN